MSWRYRERCHSDIVTKSECPPGMTERNIKSDQGVIILYQLKLDKL